MVTASNKCKTKHFIELGLASIIDTGGCHSVLKFVHAIYTPTFYMVAIDWKLPLRNVRVYQV